jgi:hypothetical protein
MLQQGGTYIFYSNGSSEDPTVGREVTLWSTKLLSTASPEETKLLNEVDQPPFTGTIFGTLSQRLAVLKEKPLAKVRVLAGRGRKIYSGKTDEKGNFEIKGLPAGDYRLGADIGDAFALELESTEEPVHVEPHGCFQADLTALNNATIRGRITLPAGLKVEGTEVLARATTGAGYDLKGVADPDGRYEIVGLSPGEYVVGINLGSNYPRAEAPFPATYYPGTRRLEEAKKFVIQGPAHFSDVDISVPVAGEVVTLTIQATFEDGRPAPEQLVGLSNDGANFRIGHDTDAQGMATLRAVRGTRYFVMDYGVTLHGCPEPVIVGPEDYPDVVHLVYSQDGCRKARNVTAAGMLRWGLQSEFSQLPVVVRWSDGSPVYDANVSIMSSGQSLPFTAVFRTGKDGQVDVPVPLNQEFRLQAEIFCAKANHGSRALLFNTKSGIRWRQLETNSEGMPVWNSLATPASPILLVLEGAPCKSGSAPQ